ncbi:hypothetical protein PDK47_27755, partial [Bacillus cereus group sp. TH40LC]|nr:hypothetical protein [Bacillus cereus group sp. TH40LC]
NLNDSILESKEMTKTLKRDIFVFFIDLSIKSLIILVTISIPLLISLEDKYADEKETENV